MARFNLSGVWRRTAEASLPARAIAFPRGESTELRVTVVDECGVAVDLSALSSPAFSLAVTSRFAGCDGTPAEVLTVAGALVPGVVEKNVVMFLLPSAETLAIPPGYYLFSVTLTVSGESYPLTALSPFNLTLSSL